MYLSMCFHFPGSARGVAVRELTATSGRVLYWPIVALPPTSQTWLLILAYSSECFRSLNTMALQRLHQVARSTQEHALLVPSQLHAKETQL